MARKRSDSTFFYKGYECIIYWHGDMGHYNGYVVIPEDNMWRMLDAEDLIWVHGGITFSGKHSILKKWCLGFDCGHAGDRRLPDNFLARSIFSHIKGDVFRSKEYVKTEIKQMVDQMETHKELTALL